MNRITFLFVLIILGLQISKATTPSLSQPRQNLAAISIGDLAIFAGGYNGSTVSDRVDIFNYLSNNWTIASLSESRNYLATTSVGDLAIFAGGCNASDGYCGIGRFSERVDIYNYLSNNWTTASLSQPRSYFGATSVGSLALFAGGYCCNNGVSDNSITLVPTYNRVDIYNYTSNTWNTPMSPSLSQPRHSLAATSVGDLALFAGGCNVISTDCAGGYSDQVDIYNYISNTWSTASLSQPRYRLATISVGNLALFAGGQISGFSDRVDIYNYTSSTWSTATLSQPRGGLAATSVGSLALFAGGYKPPIMDLVDIYNSTYNFWTPQTCEPGTYVNPEASIGSCSDCPEGTYSNVVNSQGCFNCSIGTYSNVTGTTQCQQCPPGTYCQDDGCINCDPCQAGSSPNEGATNCTQCLPGTYSLEGWSQCSKCPPGTYCQNESCSVCDPCQAGSYSSEGSSECLKCPSGTTSKPQSGSCSKTENSGLSTTLKIIISIIAVIFVLILIGIILAVKYAHRHQTNTALNLELVDTGRWTVIKKIQVGERLGGGNFGDVYKGIWNGTTPVALKQLKSEDQLQEFTKEADVLQTLNHPNIVRFLGIHTTSTGEQFIVMEYLSKGSVDNLLVLEKQSIKLVDLLAMAKDAAAGMLYLEQQKIVHRDLALRNLLALPGEQGKYTAKVSDFGLSRQIKEEGFYMKPENTGIPIRWSAPEVLEKGVYTSKSDVWSFGIMLWELFSYGKIPYPGMTNVEVMQKVAIGHRLACPDHCPQEMYELMLHCWQQDPESRPGFKEIYDKIESIWNEHRTGSVEIVVEQNLNIQPSNSNYGNRVTQQPFNSNYNNQVAIAQPSTSNYNNRTSSNYNNQAVQSQNNSNYN